ncbi:MAG: SusD/RagB family nutrient-binding outer membrane lipoprotein [Bacteroidetes bacterium]|nr:SusD/RagB family nutrient-binding outer membrane lipoprotein [Bacteroidota bacterium]
MFQVDEAWAEYEYRRTGYPLNWVGSAPTLTGGIMPRRLTYSPVEYLLKEANVTAAATKLQGGDKLTSHV